MNVNSLRQQILDRAAGSASFRARLLEDARAAIEEEIGSSVPRGFSIAVQDDPVAGLQVTVSGAMSLSDEELSGIVGGAEGDPDNPWHPYDSEEEANDAWQQQFPGTDPPWAS